MPKIDPRALEALYALADEWRARIERDAEIVESLKRAAKDAQNSCRDAEDRLYISRHFGNPFVYAAERARELEEEDSEVRGDEGTEG